MVFGATGGDHRALRGHEHRRAAIGGVALDVDGLVEHHVMEGACRQGRGERLQGFPADEGIPGAVELSVRSEGVRPLHGGSTVDEKAVSGKQISDGVAVLGECWHGDSLRAAKGRPAQRICYSAKTGKRDQPRTVVVWFCTALSQSTSQDVQRREDLLQSHPAFEAGEVRPEAEVDAVSERHVVVDLAMDVEAIGVREGAFVAVGGGRQKAQDRTLRDDPAVPFAVSGAVAGLDGRWRLESQQLLDGVGDRARGSRPAR